MSTSMTVLTPAGTSEAGSLSSGTGCRRSSSAALEADSAGEVSSRTAHPLVTACPATAEPSAAHQSTNSALARLRCSREGEAPTPRIPPTGAASRRCRRGKATPPGAWKSFAIVIRKHRSRRAPGASPGRRSSSPGQDAGASGPACLEEGQHCRLVVARDGLTDPGDFGVQGVHQREQGRPVLEEDVSPNGGARRGDPAGVAQAGGGQIVSGPGELCRQSPKGSRQSVSRDVREVTDGGHDPIVHLG